jgi:hypothetical protein
MSTTNEHHVGELAYLDTFTGMVPAKVLAIEPNMTYGRPSRAMLTCLVTATRGAYIKGERVWVCESQVIPRTNVRISSGQYRINDTFSWK